MLLSGTKGKRTFQASTYESITTRGVCGTCDGVVRRSSLTGILHKHCFVCRYLRMIYGPSIKVRRM